MCVGTPAGTPAIVSVDHFPFIDESLARPARRPGAAVCGSWAEWDRTNPRAGDYGGVMIRRSTGGVPRAPSSNDTLVTDTAESATSFADSGPSADTTYSYALFRHDASHLRRGGDHGQRLIGQ